MQIQLPEALDTQIEAISATPIDDFGQTYQIRVELTDGQTWLFPVPRHMVDEVRYNGTLARYLAQQLERRMGE